MGQSGVLDSDGLQVVREDASTTADLHFDIRGTSAGKPSQSDAATLVNLTIPATEIPLALGAGRAVALGVAWIADR